MNDKSELAIFLMVTTMIVMIVGVFSLFGDLNSYFELKEMFGENLSEMEETALSIKWNLIFEDIKTIVLFGAITYILNRNSNSKTKTSYC